MLEISTSALSRFSRQLELVLTHNAFYREKFRGVDITASPDDLDTDAFLRLPMTTREELSRDQLANLPYGTNLGEPLHHYLHYHQTSGTSGMPLRWLDTAESWEWWLCCWQKSFKAAATSSHDRFFFPFSFGPFIGFWSAFEAVRKMGALAISGGGMSSERRLQTALENGTTVLLTTPSYALHLAATSKQSGIPIQQSSIRKLILAGEPGASISALRSQLEESWGAQIFDHAGSTETGPWGIPCPHHNGIHVDTDEFIAEVIDEDGNPANSGELVLTNLGRTPMPVIRYRTGDRVELDASPCSCGSNYPLLTGGVQGRIDDALVIRGLVIYPIAFENAVRTSGDIDNYLVEIDRSSNLDSLRILILPSPACDPNKVIQRLRNEIRISIGLSCEVEAVAAEQLPQQRFKSQRIRIID